MQSPGIAMLLSSFVSTLAVVGTMLQPSTAIPNPVVRTNFGSYQGTTSEYVSGVNVFKGIRYAGSTAGANRWTHPPHPNNFTGVANATRFGNQCPQPLGNSAAGSGGLSIEGDEDCLFLNIWTPEGFTNTSSYPVFFWIYGGRFEGGSGSSSTYDGSGLARKDVVVVTFNYRLGVLGFLAHPSLSGESGYNASGNYGLMDQQAALHWTNENIQQFGGNASQITIGGQSAGAASVLEHVYSPLASGLFHGAISESGARGTHDPITGSLATSHRNKSTAEAQGISYLGSLNITSVAQARNASVDTLLGSGSQDDTTYEGTPFLNNQAYREPPLWRPVIDGYVLPYTYTQALANASHNDVPLLTGNNKDESGAEPDPEQTLSTYNANNTAIFASVNLNDTFFALFPAMNDVEANNQTNNLYRNQSLVSTWLYANAWTSGGAKSPVYTYYWTHSPPGQDQGAFHGSEINYVLDNLPYGSTLPGETLNWTTQDYVIADTMSQYWINFMKTGNPNGNNLTRWDASAEAKARTMMLGDVYGMVDIATDGVVDFVEKFFKHEIAW